MIREFFVHLCICHTVIPEINQSTHEITYNASSPDEEALVKGATLFGFRCDILVTFYRSSAPINLYSLTFSINPQWIQNPFQVFSFNPPQGPYHLILRQV